MEIINFMQIIWKDDAKMQHIRIFSIKSGFLSIILSQNDKYTSFIINNNN